MTVSAPGGLSIRDVPIGAKGTQVVGYLANGAKVEVTETQQIGEDVWARIGKFEWCAIKYKGVNYLV